jgi:serine/threonine protein kinase/CheY-like chemotaxis protein
MSRPLLLIVDGEPLRTSGLVSAMEGDGWMVRWVRSEDVQPFPETDQVPDLILLDPSAPGGAGYALASALRERKPRLPVLVLSEGPPPQAAVQGEQVDIQAFLDSTQPNEVIAAALRLYRPDGAKHTMDEVFGELLGEVESPAAPLPADPFAMFTLGAVAEVPLAPEPLLSTDDIFGPVLAEVEPNPGAGPEQGNAPVQTAMLLPDGMAHSLSGAAPKEAEAQGPPHYTLSGISGVDDPFVWAATSVKPAPKGAPTTPTRSEVPGVPEAIEEYGNYYLLEKIAVGGMAELFKAQQRGVQGFQKIVAIKRILPHYSENEDFVTMFIDEAKLAAQLTHPNIAQIFDLGKAGNSYYIAMEYVHGHDLRTLLKKVREFGAPLPEQVAAFVAMKVAAALDYAHRKRGFDDRELKLVHRDISPQNVILSTEGAVKLVDFGIAKAASKASHTIAGALKGKLLYMSPEQATGQPLDNRSDLYSLGLVLFELLTGERCFQADSELGVLEKVRLGRIANLTTLNPDVSRDMAGIVNRALQKGVEHRYPSARFMERDLREYLQRQGIHITEHDVAEYMTALYKGSRENLEHLVSTRFPVPASHTSGVHRRLGEFLGPATHSGEFALQETALRPVPEEVPQEFLESAEPPRPRWLLPVILALAVILVIMLAVAGRS